VKAAVLWTPQAREDLLDIYVAIGLDNAARVGIARRTLILVAL